MNPAIPATTDDRLAFHGTTEYSCECEGLRFKTDIHVCPWTGDRLCRHMYRFRLNSRRARISLCFEKIVLPHLMKVFGAKLAPDLRHIYKPVELERLDLELARLPEPKVRKPRAKKTAAAVPAEAS